MRKRIQRFSLLCIMFFVAACNNHRGSDEKTTIINDSSETDLQTESFLRNDTFSVVRIEKQRVFVVIDSSQVTNVNIIKAVLGSIKKNYAFEKLRVSFFSDSVYTGYKTEFISDSGAIIQWANAYIGEYDLLTKEYWTYPLRPDAKLKYIIR